MAILLGGIGASGGLLQRVFELPDATVNVLQGMLFLAILLSDTFYGRRWFARAKGGARERAPAASRSASSAARSGSARRSCSSAWANA